MKTLVYMIRHGESLGNLEKRFLGHTDLPLTDKGRAQAARAAAYLSANGIRPDAVYASSLSRALETARIATGKEPVPTLGMREIYAGEWEGLAFSEIGARYPEEMKRWNEDIGASRPTEGESVRELCDKLDGGMSASDSINAMDIEEDAPERAPAFDNKWFYIGAGIVVAAILIIIAIIK